MIAAVYARKSNDEGDKSEDAKSVTRQLAGSARPRSSVTDGPPGT